MDLVAHVRDSGLLSPGARVLVLLSGGRDSVCLLDVCRTLLGPAAVGALHVDYGLRPESGEDAAWCVSLGRRLGVEVTVERARRPEQAGNTQAWARDVRYAAAVRVAGAAGPGGGGALIAAGHTADDQAETVLYRLAASPGRRALLGMAPRSGRLVRPLLSVTRAQVTDHCRARGLTWREDASNAGDAYARGRVRHGLLAALREVDDRAADNVVRTAALLREEAEVLDTVVDTALAGRDRIAVEHLRELPPALARLVVRRLAEDATGALCARAASRLADVLELGDGSLDVGDGARLVVDHGVLHATRTPPQNA